MTTSSFFDADLDADLIFKLDADQDPDPDPTPSLTLFGKSECLFRELTVFYLFRLCLRDLQI